MMRWDDRSAATVTNHELYTIVGWFTLLSPLYISLPGVHVHTEAISAGELGVIARGQGHQHIPGLRRAPVTWSSHMIHWTLGLVIRDSYLLLSKCWLPEDSLILSSLQSPRDTLLNTCMSGVRSLMNDDEQWSPVIWYFPKFICGLPAKFPSWGSIEHPSPIL